MKVSLHTARALRRPALDHWLTRRPKVRLAILIRSRDKPCYLDEHLPQDASTDGCRSSFAFLNQIYGSADVLATSDQTDVGISSALPLALASSVIPRLCLLTRLTVRSAQLGWDEVNSFAMFHNNHRMI